MTRQAATGNTERRSNGILPPGLLLRILMPGTLTILTGCSTPEILPPGHGDGGSPEPTLDQASPTPLIEVPEEVTALRMSNEFGRVTARGILDALDIVLDLECTETASGACDQLVILEELHGTELEATVQSPGGLQGFTADLSASLPSPVVVSVDTLAGDVSFTGLSGGVSARADIGNITGTDLFGNAVIKTTYGDVLMDVRLKEGGSINIAVGEGTDIGGGDINLTIPYNTSAEFSATTLSGKITLVDIVGVWNSQTSATGTMGHGDGQILLFTTQGNITVIGEDMP